MIEFHKSELSLNDLLDELGFTTDRSGEHPVLHRNGESFLRPPYMEMVYRLCVAGEIAWYPHVREWAHVRGLATDKRKAA